MKSIMGFALNNVKIEKGEVHEKVTGELIMDGCRIGDVINDGWCDGFYIEVNDPAKEEELEKRLKIYTRHESISDLDYDMFISELLVIHKNYRHIPNDRLGWEQLSFLWK